MSVEPGHDLQQYRLILTVLLLALLACLACTPAPPGSAPPESDRLVNAFDELLERWHALGRFSGAIAVVADGDLLFAKGFGLADRAAGIENTAETRFDLASLTKQLTAAAILKLEADGKLRVDDTISTHLPDYPRPAGDRITIHHLLSHTSGIPSLWRLGDGLESVQATSTAVSVDDLLALFQDRELLFEPGDRFRYSNSGYVVLAAIIAEISGRPYEDYLEEAIFRPLGMNATGCRSLAQDAQPYAGVPPAVTRAAVEHPSWSIGDGCARSSVLDLVQWDAVLQDDRLLPQAQREKLFATHAEIRSGLRYGYGWFLTELHGRPVIRHSGAGEGVISEMVRFPGERLTIVALANYGPEIGVNAPDAIIEHVASIYFGLRHELPPAVAAHSNDETKRWTGRYEMDSGILFDIEASDGKMWWVGAENTASIFDLGVLGDPTPLERGAETAMNVLRAGLAGDFDDIAICESLRAELTLDELRKEWRELLQGHGDLVEMTPAQTDRYRGEDTLIMVTHLSFEREEIFFSLDLTPALEVCGWYTMDLAEFEIRRSRIRPIRVPLSQISPGEFLADGFNYRERDVRLEFRSTDEQSVDVTLKSVVEHHGRRLATQ